MSSMEGKSQPGAQRASVSEIRDRAACRSAMPVSDEERGKASPVRPAATAHPAAREGMHRVRGCGAAFAAALIATLAPVATGASLSCGDVPRDASRIAVAGGSLTEILYALDEQERIVAVDRTATYPPSARELPQLGYVRDISAEGLLSMQPTFVLGEHDMGPPQVLEQLERLDVDVLLVPEEFSVDGIRAKISCVAAALGREADGERLAGQLLAGVASGAAQQIEQAVVDETAPAGIVLLGLREGAPVAAGADTSGEGLLTMAGVRNLLRFEGWKPVSVEAMAAARPEFIVIPERGVRMAGGVEALLEHPALRLTPAAQHRRVVSMDGMAMLGFGPRTAAAAAQLRARLIEEGLLNPGPGDGLVGKSGQGDTASDTIGVVSRYDTAGEAGTALSPAGRAGSVEAVSVEGGE